MSSWTALLDRAEPEQHFVQLYGADDKLLTRHVSRYLAEGVRRGDGLVLIATPGHAEAIVRDLSERSTDAEQALAEGRLLVLDAQQTLDRFLVNGTPDRSRFRSVVGAALQAARTRSLTGRLRAFGEMVALLWTSGQRAEAIRLEELWNELLAGSDCSLFCAYPINLSDSGSPTDGLDSVLASHTHMLAGPRTVLSSARATPLDPRPSRPAFAPPPPPLAPD